MITEEDRELAKTMHLWIKGSVLECIVEDYRKWYRKYHGKEL